MSLHVLGVSHRTADSQVRAEAALTPERTRSLLSAAASRTPDLEVMVLATCGRTEFYLSGDDAVERWSRLLADACPAAPGRSTGWYVLHGDDAVRHLLRVACGLDSALLGDSQITGQLRGAAGLAQEAGTLRAVLSPLVATALRTAREARSTTDIGLGAPGVGPAAAEALVTRGVRHALVLGTGSTARLVLRSLRKSGVPAVSVAGRTSSAASALAAEMGARAISWETVDRALTVVDGVVVATGALAPVLVRVPERSGHLVVVDAGFPAQVGEIARDDVDVVPLQALTSASDAAARRRRRAVPQVESLVERVVDQWRVDQESRPVEELIRSLHLGLQGLGLEREADLAVRSLLHDHVTRLRALRPAAPVAVR